MKKALFAILAVLVGVVFISNSHVAHAVAGDCTLVVPANPLTAQGLSTPYQLLSPCHENDPNTQVFVQAVIVNTDTGALSVYNPLVTDQGVAPAIAPVVPALPANNVVGIWFGANGNNLTLQDGAGFCKFGNVQFAYCNAPAFFATVNNLHITIPTLGTGKDGKVCPTVRDFSIVDQDQSDNLTATYLLTGAGQTAQNTSKNRASLGTVLAKNPSDERLLTLVDKALGCVPFMAPDLADGGTPTTALALNELMAAADQAAPIGLVPAGDPFVGPNNQTLLNQYRRGVDQPTAGLVEASTKTYCQNLLAVAPTRLNLDQPFTIVAASPMPDVANSLWTFLAQRFSFTFSANGLNCVGLLGVTNPVSLTFDGAGAVTAATIV